MKQYRDLVQKVLERGSEREDRTGTGTFSLFGESMKFDLTKEFPICTLKKVSYYSVFTELMWFLKGRNDVQWLRDRKVKIWDEWEREDGTIGPGYGVQWRNWNGIDQIAQVQKSLVENLFSRRHIVSAWNVYDIEEMALPPCHLLFQFYVDDGKLSIQVYQRSADLFLGIPFNLASYATLVHLMAKTIGLEPGEYTHVIGDAHVYMNHLDQVDEMLSREEVPGAFLEVCTKRENVWDYVFADVVLRGYDPHPAIKAPVAV